MAFILKAQYTENALALQLVAKNSTAIGLSPDDLKNVIVSSTWRPDDRIQRNVRTRTPAMASYAVGILQEVPMGDAVVEYLERIDATLQPLDGPFIVHGGPPDVLEGASPGTLIVIEFP